MAMESMRSVSRSCSATGSGGDQPSTTPPDAARLPSRRRTMRRYTPREKLESYSTPTWKGGVPGRRNTNRTVTTHHRAAKLQVGLSTTETWALVHAELQVPALGGRFVLTFELPDHSCAHKSGTIMPEALQDDIAKGKCNLPVYVAISS